ncbi:helix-turn-helix domain-containing protein [Sandaracinobacteroides saxicola]|uniref:helix-turn-helix domain-containing protein n=1 Tax=Sandaracinobacteroides saxicola TaxID=2759707 RepID=UPI001A9C8733|nr:TetR/AcrR family transcriptional regulator [Sandaracinobacteroides saxicola]
MSKTEMVRAAAVGVFARYGYARTTMADLAAAAGMSRPALYLLFAGKEALFRDLAEALTGEALAAGEAAWPEGVSLRQGLPAALIAKDLPIFRLVRGSPHGDEILAASNRLSADLHAAMEARFAAFLAARLAAAGVAEPAACARMLVAAAHGIKERNRDEADFVADLTRLARLVQA